MESGAKRQEAILDLPSAIAKSAAFEIAQAGTLIVI